jgi:acyl transferase domain-containing protein
LIPQQLLALKVSDRAIQDAGLQPSRPVAVIVAMGQSYRCISIVDAAIWSGNFGKVWNKPD